METPSSVDTDTVCEELNYKQEKQSRNSKDSEGENVEAIQKFIDEQDKEIQEQKSASNLLNDSTSDNTCEEENDNQNKKKIMIDSSVMHMILDQNVASIESKKDLMVEQKLSPIGKGNNSMALSIGSKVEVKDFSETWYCAQITEVDFEEMEVLVHCENDTKKPDEWISVNSSRLRPVGSSSVKAGPSSANSVPEDPVKEEPKEFKTKEDEKIKLTFVEGERCLARWRDNRRFLATILSNLGNGAYKILFDDGFHWSCNTSRLYKLKSTEKELTVDTNSLSSTTSTPSPGHYGAGPSDTGQGNQTIPLYPAFHTHLFDPTRDYLGSKSERREKKRKLNIKEIFNIGQKRQKTLKEPKIQMERKPRVPKRKLKKQREIKTEVKTESNAFNAVASIIGTVNNEESTTNVKVVEDKMIEPKMNFKNEIKIKTEDDDNCGVEKINNMAEEINSVDQVKDMEVDDFKADIDPVLEEEIKLEKFEKQDAIKHKEVIVRMKEVINKLEDGLIKEEKANSLKTVLKDFVQEVIINTAANELILKVTTADKQEVTTADKPEVMTAYKQEVMMTDKPEITTPGKSEVITADKPEVMTTDKLELTTADKVIQKNESLKKVSKSRKSKKLRLLQEKRVKRQVEMVKNELEQMKKQVKEMRKQMLLKTQVLEKPQGVAMMPESFLLPGEWCAKWVNGQPVGTVSEIECEMKVDPNGKPPLPRRSVQVEDKRLPGGWTKHMVRRSLGHSAGKWDVVLISPDNRRFHTKNEIRIYLENNPDMDLEPYQHALTDFGIHLKLSRRMGWIIQTPDGATDGPASPLPAGSLGITSPLVKRKKLSLKKSIKVLKAKEKKKRKKLTIKLKVPQEHVESDSHGQEVDDSVLDLEGGLVELTAAGTFDPSPVEDGCVYVGSLKVQIIDNLLRCPAENCFKNFRNTTLLQMHIKHYHRELRKSMGATPKVLDLAYARTKPPRIDSARRDGQKAIKVKVPRPHKELKLELKDIKSELQANMKALIPAKGTEIRIPRSQDSPKLRQALTPRPVKRPRVLLPVRRLEPEAPSPNSNEESDYEIIDPKQSLIDASMLEPLDFETEISTHTVTKPLTDKQQKGEKKRRPLVLPPKRSISEDDDWFGLNSDVETRSSFPRSGTPDSKVDAKMAPISPESNEEKEANMYMYTENGERIKIVHMKREEIINCHCGIREEDGLMVQCELCLCWQHALCHNIRRESEVPEKYTCSICLNPRRGRRWQRFLHDQDRLYEGLLPGARPCESLRRSHELSGNLLRIEDSLHALTVKYYVATKKDHPKLYLWAKDWEQLELKYTQEKLNSDYSDLNVMISDVGKENLPLRPDDVKDLPPDAASPPSEEHDRYSQRGEGPLLSGLLSSPGGASLELPISTMELERLAKSVQDAECERPSVRAPQPEAAIENSVCRERLLKHIQRCHALIGARLESIEAQVAELESQDPSLEDDETAEFFPRSKQTVQMLMRDLNTMEELGVIT